LRTTKMLIIILALLLWRWSR